MTEGLLCTSIDTPLGRLLLASSKAGVCRVRFGRVMAILTRELTTRRGATVTLASEPPEDVRSQFAEYFTGARGHFCLPLDYRFVTQFQRRVFEALSRVPAGRVVAYGELARRIGRPTASRGVGRALAYNPLPILVACHRVVRADGTLGGYSGGVQIKEYLLSLEGVMLPLIW